MRFKKEDVQQFVGRPFIELLWHYELPEYPSRNEEQVDLTAALLRVKVLSDIRLLIMLESPYAEKEYNSENLIHHDYFVGIYMAPTDKYGHLLDSEKDKDEGYILGVPDIKPEKLDAHFGDFELNIVQTDADFGPYAKLSATLRAVLKQGLPPVYDNVYEFLMDFTADMPWPSRKNADMLQAHNDALNYLRDNHLYTVLEFDKKFNCNLLEQIIVNLTTKDMDDWDKERGLDESDHLNDDDE